MASYQWPEELPCYQEARKFRIEVAELCQSFPKTEEYRLKDQMLRASRSVTANIAEGFGRHHHQENLQFCRQARGSLIEMCDHLNVAVDERFFSAEDMVAYRKQLECTLVSLNGYLSYLKRCASALKNT
jgi:four helix bundle protein